MSLFRILIVDDQEICRRGLRNLLSSRADLAVCGEAIDGLDAVEKARFLQPDVVLMDISMPRMNGLDATRVIRRELPESKVVIVSQNDPEVVNRQARAADAAGFVPKSDLSERLLPTLDEVIGNRAKENESHPAEVNATPALEPDWLAGGGQLGQRIREHDWTQSGLGPIETWPQSMKTSVNLILNARHPMWVGWGRDAAFLYNDPYIQVLSLSKHPWALGRPTKEVWPEIWDVIGPLIDNVYDKGEASFIDDICFLMNRGDFIEETYYSFSYSPIRDETGAVVGLFCPTTEVTPKVINARRLSTLSELSANALVQKTTDAACASIAETLAKNPQDIPFAVLYLIDSERKRARLEQACGLSTGLDALTPLTVNLSADNTQHCLWPLAQAVKTGRSQVISVDHVDGLPLGVAQQPLRQVIVLPVASRGEGGTVGILVAGVSPGRKLDPEYRTFYELVAGQIATAIQNVRAAEEERKRLEALAEIDRAKTAFFSNVSHEFRTPLTLMLGPVEDLLATSHTGLSPAAKSQLELVNRNGSRLLRLVNTLLDFSRIEAGRMQAIYQRSDLSAFTIELAGVFRSATEKAGLRLVLDCPKIEEPVYVDRGMWEKIVLNLISNAFKFTFDGEIAVSLAARGKSVELRVRDTGVGIPPAEIPRLFDRFHRIENTKSRTHEGSGIGLALVQELVKLHSGSVRAESTLGKGSTFIVSLPTGNSHLPADRIGGTRTLASTAIGAAPYVEEALRWLPETEQENVLNELPPSPEFIPVPCPPISEQDPSILPRPRVLIADDNADMRQYLVRLLAERYDVKAVPNGKAALESIRERAPDLLLSDVMMPELDGFGLLHELRAAPETRTTPIILLSARAGEESRVEGLEHGADDYLIKPFSARELLARVQTHLELARVRKQAEDALRQRTVQFETLLNAAPLGVYVVDADFLLHQVNPTARAAFGDIPNLVGRKFDELMHILWPNPYADEIVEHFRQTLKTGESYIVPERSDNRADRGVREIYEWRIDRIPLPDGRNGVVCYFRDISRIVHAREVIAESESRLRLATEAAELGIWYWYPAEDRATWENDRCYEIMDRARDEGPLTTVEFLSKVCYPEDADAFRRALSDSVETRGRFFFQGRIYCKDGSIRWIEFTGQHEQATATTSWRLSGTVLDITERKLREEALRESEGRLRLAQKAARCGTWDMNFATQELITSPELKELYGIHPGEINGDPALFRRLIHGEDLNAVDEALKSVIENRGREFHVEFRVSRLDGILVWIESNAQVFYDGDGKPARVIGVSIDITKRKEIEERERQVTAEALAATAKFRAVFEQSSVFAGIMTLDGVVIEANRMCLEVCGYESREVLGLPFWDTPWWRGSKEAQAQIRAGTTQAARGIPYMELLPYHWADGTERLMEFALHPVLDEQGKVIFLHPTGIDVTERKHAERSLLESEQRLRTLAESLERQVRIRTEELERQNREVLNQSRQLRELSHRLIQIQDNERRHIARELHDSAGQTLAVLGMNLATIVQQARELDPQLADAAEEGQALVRELSQEIRTMSYLLHPPLLDESGLCEALRWYIKGLKDRSALNITLEIPDEFERVPREMELVIFRIVQEGLTNIHRHSGSKVATIRLARDSQSVSLELQDAGRGISREKLIEIQTQGTGVGIRGMRERVIQSGGKMKIHSDTSGTKISITLPFVKSDYSPLIEPIQMQSAG